MNSKVYKWCAVPQCKNTSITTPKKVFIYVPNKKIIRDQWLKLARRKPNDVVTNSPLYFCEDHFDLPNDMENYMEYHVMGSVSQVRINPGCMPKKFICQPDRNTQTSDTTERPYIAKKQSITVLEECKKPPLRRPTDQQFKEKSIVTEQSSTEEIASGSSVQQFVEKVPQLSPRVLDKSVQVHVCKTSRSKANQTKVSSINQMISPLKLSLHSVSTSPFKIKLGVNSNPSRPILKQWVKELEKNRVQAEKKMAAASLMIAEAANKIAEVSLMNAETNRMNAETNRMNAETNRKQLEVMKAIMDVVGQPGQPSTARLRAEDSSQSENEFTAVIQTLNEKEGRNANKRQEPSEQRCRARKRPRQTDSSSEADSSDDNDDDNEQSRHDEEPEIEVGPAAVKVEPSDIIVNKEHAHADPISLDVKTEPRGDEVGNIHKMNPQRRQPLVAFDTRKKERSMLGEKEIKAGI